MPISVFEAISGNLQSLLGGAEVDLVQHEPEGKGNPFLLRETAIIDDRPYLFTASREAIPFTRTEEVFCRELLAAFAAMFTGFRQEGYAAHFRTALLASIMDITVARFLRGDHRKAFWSIQQLVQLLKNLSYQRYEGKPATTGFLIHRTKLPDFRKRVRNQKYTWTDLHPLQPVTADFFANPLTYRFIDGVNALFVGNIQMQISGIIRTNATAEREEIDRLTHRGAFTLLQGAGSGAFAVKVNEASEIEAIIPPDKLLVRRRGNWAIFDPDIIRSFLGNSLEAEAASDLLWTIYALSKTRHGTVILIWERGPRQLAALKKGAVGGEDPLGQLLIRQVKGKSIGQLKQAGELIRILSSDGMTVFNRKGKLMETGLIIDTSPARQVVAGGGRTTAACAASHFGKAIKVSEDGPIELYHGGNCIYRFG